MAAGAGAVRGPSSSSSSSSASLESTLDRRLQGVTNTMESIQGLSTWCIENKKQHALVVRYWVKWLKKSDAAHRLNLFYLANDVIQNCKRKNAVIYRSSFAEVLPEAAQLVKDGKVRRSVERIFSIWEERNVYPEELINKLRSNLTKKEAPAAVNPKIAMKSKIVAEFSPQTFIDQLSAHRRSLEESELKEKQLSAMRVDVCSTEALKRLKDKAGGKKFSKDFEEGSAKLQEFVSFLEQQAKGGPALMEALSNADVFYEMQYKEVKIVANAYKTFANRVSNLKRKLDALKSTLPDPDDSPIPSPSEDAPSPTGSESPFHGMGASAAKGDRLERDTDDKAVAMDELEDAPSPVSSPGGSQKHGEGDNRDVEDMELSEGEEAESTSIIVEERREKPAPIAVPSPTPKLSPLSVTRPGPAVVHKPAPATMSKHTASASPKTLPTTAHKSSPTTAAKPTAAVPKTAPFSAPKLAPPAVPKPAPTAAVPKTTPLSVSKPTPAQTPVTSEEVQPKKPSPAFSTTSSTPGTPVAPATPLPVNLANVDLGKISSILSSLTSVMKNTGVSPVSRPSPGTPTTPSTQGSAAKPTTPTPAGAPAANPLASILSRVDISPEGILSALSKTQGQPGGLQGLSSLLHSVAGNATSVAASKEHSSNPAPAAPVRGSAHTSPVPSSTVAPDKKTSAVTPKHFKREVEREKGFSPSSSSSPNSLESKIHKFLQGNPGFSAIGPGVPILGGDRSDSPLLGSENVDGTPVRDETGGTPTQDELMDAPSPKSLPPSVGHSLSPTAYRRDSWEVDVTSQAKEGGNYRSSRYSHPSVDKAASKPAPKQSGQEAVSKRRKSGTVTGLDVKVSSNAGGDRRSSSGRKTSAEEQQAHEEKVVEERKQRAQTDAPPSSESEEQHYHRIETLVSSSCAEGAPIETLGYSNRRMSGERIQTVESIRVIGRGGRTHSRGGGGRPGWYDEDYLEGLAPPPSLSLLPHPSTSDERAVPPPPHLLPPHLPPVPFSFEDRPIPPSSFFNSPPPPIPQPPPPPQEFLAPPTPIMVGGMLVPFPHEVGERGGGANGNPPPPLMSSRPGKEHFKQLHTPPLHRPGAPGPPPPLLGCIRDTPSPPLPSPAVDPPSSPPSHRPSSPVSLLHLPNPSLHPHPAPFLRNRTPRPTRPPHFDRESSFRGGKRSGPPFGNSFYPPKRPYLPPRY